MLLRQRSISVDYHQQWRFWSECLESYYASASVIRKEEAITKNATSIIIIEIIIFGILIVWAHIWGDLYYLISSLTRPLTRNRSLTNGMQWLIVCSKSCYCLPCFHIARHFMIFPCTSDLHINSQTFRTATISFISSNLRSVWVAC